MKLDMAKSASASKGSRAMDTLALPLMRALLKPENAMKMLNVMSLVLELESAFASLDTREMGRCVQPLTFAKATEGAAVNLPTAQQLALESALVSVRVVTRATAKIVTQSTRAWSRAMVVAAATPHAGSPDQILVAARAKRGFLEMGLIAKL